MRVVVQRVREARVMVGEKMVGEIGQGLLVFAGIGKNDTQSDIDYIVNKVVSLRIFPDEDGKFNRSLKEMEGGILIVSQFTLWGDCRKGRRPSFAKAAAASEAEEIYGKLVERFKSEGLKVATGQFQAMMDVHLINDGPVTLLLDSEKLF